MIISRPAMAAIASTVPTGHFPERQSPSLPDHVPMQARHRALFHPASSRSVVTTDKIDAPPPLRTNIPRPSFIDRQIFKRVNERLFLRRPALVKKYKKNFGRKPNIAAPARMSELMQWRKLLDHNPLFPILLDKIRSKDWVHERCPELAIPETVWTGTSVEALPSAFFTADYVIKANHGCNYNFFPGRSTLDEDAARRKLSGWLKQSFGNGNQWGYTRIPRRILVERRIPGSPLIDISIRCMDGHAEAASIATNYKTAEERLDYFELDGTRMQLAQSIGMEALPDDFVVPPEFFDAIGFARRLSVDLDYVRVDFLLGETGLYFSEVTIYPASGFGADNEIAVRVFRQWLRHFDACWFMSARHKFPRNLYASAFRRWIRRLQKAVG